MQVRSLATLVHHPNADKWHNSQNRSTPTFGGGHHGQALNFSQFSRSYPLRIPPPPPHPCDTGYRCPSFILARRPSDSLLLLKCHFPLQKSHRSRKDVATPKEGPAFPSRKPSGPSFLTSTIEEEYILYVDHAIYIKKGQESDVWRLWPCSLRRLYTAAAAAGACKTRDRSKKNQIF